MEATVLAKGVVVFTGAVNLGAVVADKEVIFLDAGLDDGAARKLWRWAEEQGLQPRAAILTHAHADHFGGAHLWVNRGLALYASRLEGMMMEHPICEPLFLFSGASPLPDLLSKFTFAKPCKLAGALGPGPFELGSVVLEIIELSGHTPAQIGVRLGNVLFCADALFPPEILAKHPIPFCHDLDQAILSLRVVEETEVVVPGHGPLLTGATLRAACAAFRGQLERIREAAFQALTTPRTTEEVLSAVAEKVGERLTSLTAVLLAQTTVLAALASLVRAGLAAPVVEGNRLLWQRV
ncbi:MAG: MBL fold metallo-hydrolase [Candidatus Bipolaricaulota bacterium]|nr:MBL fold metallo-hydrolase [Candidatus Bipolaricaulota bacterium]MDW8126765.1 MBL fold metallo-hydrolase [Candidatus Bipolaricaulota bacterium]